MLCEGQEKDDFWNLLGGKGEYSTSPRLAEVNLLQCMLKTLHLRTDRALQFVGMRARELKKERKFGGGEEGKGVGFESGFNSSSVPSSLL